MADDNRLPRSTPESQGIPSSAIQGFVEAVEKQSNELHSFMLLRHGSVIAEGWWNPYRAERPHMLFSLSKSFTSTAVGMAVTEGRLTIEDRVLSFFPEDAPAHVSKNLGAMQVRHLLSMSTGHTEDTMGYMAKRRDGNWVKAFLACPVKYAPGTHFLYNTGASYILSAIIQKLTGMTLLSYLQSRLLELLGIQNATSESSPQGINMGGFGMMMTTEDIACFGQMYLQKGLWAGKRILSEAWIEQATSHQISNGTRENSDWDQGYGYQFWRCRHNAYRGDGAFGQFCIVMPEQDVVLAITAGVPNPDMQVVLNLIWDHLLPSLVGMTALSNQSGPGEQLAEKLRHLAFLPPSGRLFSSIQKDISGKTYTIEPNVLKVSTISFDFTKSDCTITLRNPKGTHQISCGAGVWREGITTLVTTLVNHSPCAVASGVWSTENTFDVTLRFYETPFVHTISCQFDQDRLTFNGVVNVSFVPTTYSLVGRLSN